MKCSQRRYYHLYGHEWLHCRHSADCRVVPLQLKASCFVSHQKRRKIWELSQSAILRTVWTRRANVNGVVLLCLLLVSDVGGLRPANNAESPCQTQASALSVRIARRRKKEWSCVRVSRGVLFRRCTHAMFTVA